MDHKISRAELFDKENADIKFNSQFLTRIADALHCGSWFHKGERSPVTCDHLNQLIQFRERITRWIFFSLITNWGLIKYCLRA